MTDKKKIVDTGELQVPETLFVRNIEDEVFVGIVLKVLSSIKGISLLSGSFFDKGTKGIQIKQDSQHHSVNVRIDVNIRYGVSIPEKAEEIQSRVAESITQMTGLHVSSVHVIFKNIELKDPPQTPE